MNEAAEHPATDEKWLADVEQTMIEVNAEIRAAHQVLPTWFVGRMMGDTWQFGLMMDTGVTIEIERIEKVRPAMNGDIWLDVILTEGGSPDAARFSAPTKRTFASINARHVVAAFELADT